MFVPLGKQADGFVSKVILMLEYKGLTQQTSKHLAQGHSLSQITK